MIEAPPPPSVFLPPLRPPPSPETACTFIEQLEAIFTPRTIVVDLRGPELERKDEVKGDTFETEHARGWVERVLALGMRYAGDETTLGYAWEAVVDRAASLLAGISAGTSPLHYYVRGLIRRVQELAERCDLSCCQHSARASTSARRLSSAIRQGSAPGAQHPSSPAFSAPHRINSSPPSHLYHGVFWN
jgi:hypothetical protein